jgi:hypothetical protein
MTEQLKVTSPEEYAEIVKLRTELVPLPSGLVVRARRMNMDGRALKGGLPMSLLRAAGSLKAVTENPDPTPEQIEETQQALIFVRELARKSCVEPAIVYDDEGIVVWMWPNGTRLDIEDDDFAALVAWVQGEEVDAHDSFRNRAERRASAAQSRRTALRSESVDAAEEQPA